MEFDVLLLVIGALFLAPLDPHFLSVQLTVKLYN